MRFLPLLLALSCLACTPAALDTATGVLTVASASYEATRASVATGEGADLRHCLADVPPAEGPACVDATAARWHARRAAVLALYAALLSAREAIALARVHVALGDPPDTDQIARAVSAVLDAARAVAEAK